MKVKLLQFSPICLLSAYKGLKPPSYLYVGSSNLCLLSAYKGLKLMLILKTTRRVDSLLSAYKGLKLDILSIPEWVIAKFIKCL